MPMNFNVQFNADRFTGFADVYNTVRPKMPDYVPEMITKYLGRVPENVVDLGCGTGLSTYAWQGKCRQVTGVEPSGDMIAEARENAPESVNFIQRFGFDTGLPGGFADAAVCSQSFHWMDPETTLPEISRILKAGGVFATVDNDWPPVCDVRAELAYQELFKTVRQIEQNRADIKDSFKRWEKEKHLSNIKNSGLFAYAREILFANREKCTSDRLIGLAMSQGSVQKILKTCPGLLAEELGQYEKTIRGVFGDESFSADFCYRMRIGVKAQE